MVNPQAGYRFGDFLFVRESPDCYQFRGFLLCGEFSVPMGKEEMTEGTTYPLPLPCEGRGEHSLMGLARTARQTHGREPHPGNGLT